MDATVQDAAFRNGDRSKILSHSVRLLETASSSPIFTRSLASNRLSPSNAFFCSSIIHSSKYFSRPSELPLEYPVITLRLNSSSNSSCSLGLKLGTLLKNSHASFFLAWKRRFSSARVSRVLDLATTPLVSYSRVVVSLKPRPYQSLQRRASMFLPALQCCLGLACSIAVAVL